VNPWTHGPVSLITAAVVAGACRWYGSTVGTAVSDAYASLKALILRRFGGEDQVARALDDINRGGDVTAMRQRLEAVGIDDAMVRKATGLSRADDPDGPWGEVPGNVHRRSGLDHRRRHDRHVHVRRMIGPHPPARRGLRREGRRCRRLRDGVPGLRELPACSRLPPMGGPALKPGRRAEVGFRLPFLRVRSHRRTARRGGVWVGVRDRARGTQHRQDVDRRSDGRRAVTCTTSTSQRRTSARRGSSSRTSVLSSSSASAWTTRHCSPLPVRTAGAGQRSRSSVSGGGTV
jgi:hypothetical protein